MAVLEPEHRAAGFFLKNFHKVGAGIPARLENLHSD
jgi:hypothetical protein